jgi:hypothetical protein
MTYMFPPSSLIWSVTAASPIQTSAKTPEKAKDFCSGSARKEMNKLRSRQKSRGPLWSYQCLFRRRRLRCRRTKDPSLSAPHSCLGSTQHLHQAIFLTYSSRFLRVHLLLVLPLQHLHHFLSRRHQASDWATERGASSPTQLASLSTRLTIHFHRGCCEERVCLHLRLWKSDSADRSRHLVTALHQCFQ